MDKFKPNKILDDDDERISDSGNDESLNKNFGDKKIEGTDELGDTQKCNKFYNDCLGKWPCQQYN